MPRRPEPRAYRRAYVGGTFQSFHPAHQQLLMLAFGAADHVVIYVAHEDHVAKNKGYEVLPVADRMKAIKDFLDYYDYDPKRYEIVEGIDEEQMWEVMRRPELEVFVAGDDSLHALEKANEGREVPLMFVARSRPVVRDGVVEDLSSTGFGGAQVEIETLGDSRELL